MQQLGRQNEVALVGFDDFPLADLLRPAGTVIAQNPAEMGRVAASLIFRRLDGCRTAGYARHGIAFARKVTTGAAVVNAVVASA